jgi:hypothetical protein
LDPAVGLLLLQPISMHYLAHDTVCVASRRNVTSMEGHEAYATHAASQRGHRVLAPTEN